VLSPLLLSLLWKLLYSKTSVFLFARTKTNVWLTMAVVLIPVLTLTVHTCVLALKTSFLVEISALASQSLKTLTKLIMLMSVPKTTVAVLTLVKILKKHTSACVQITCIWKPTTKLAQASTTVLAAHVNNNVLIL